MARTLRWVLAGLLLAGCLDLDPEGKVFAFDPEGLGGAGGGAGTADKGGGPGGGAGGGSAGGTGGTGGGAFSEPDVGAGGAGGGAMALPQTAGTCASPHPLTFTDGALTVTGATAGTTSAITGGACPPPSGGSFGGGPEVVYAFTQPETGYFGASIFAGAGNRAVLYLRSACASTPSLTCAPAAAAGGRAYISVPSLPAGPYFLVADSATGTQGAYTVYATRGATTPTGGEGCGAPVMAALTGRTVTYLASTASMAQDLAPSVIACDKSTSTGARDMVFQFTAPRSGPLTVTVSSAADLVVSVRKGATCGSATEAGCFDAPANEPDVGTLEVAAGSTYWIWISGFTETDSGPFALNLWLP